MKKNIVSLLAIVGIHNHLSAEQKHDIGVAAAQVAPGAVAASSARFIGLPLSDWAIIATIFFVALQAAYLIWKWRRDYLREIERKEKGLPAPATSPAPLKADR